MATQKLANMCVARVRPFPFLDLARTAAGSASPKPDGSRKVEQHEDPACLGNPYCSGLNNLSRVLGVPYYNSSRVYPQTLFYL